MSGCSKEDVTKAFRCRMLDLDAKESLFASPRKVK